MLKHGRAGVPMEVMGLMLGEFVDDYTVRVIDVFAMPQSGTVSALFVVTLSLYTYAVNIICKLLVKNNKKGRMLRNYINWIFLSVRC